MDENHITEPRHRSVACMRPEGFRRMAYVEWGDPTAKRLVICCHGLTRNGRDFDFLAQRLAGQGCRVICPDVLGRGLSDWLDDPMGYLYPYYVSDMAALIARSGAETVEWIGTSMGGLIGMMLAAQAKSPISLLVINDVGPMLPKAALQRIVDYVGLDPVWPTIEAAEASMRTSYAAFGPLTDAQWRHMAEHSVRTREDGQLSPAYDPQISAPLRAQPVADVELWPIWGAVRCPTLVLRGAESDLLLPATADIMKTTGPKAEVVEFAGIGHAPALMDQAQIDVVVEWLNRPREQGRG